MIIQGTTFGKEEKQVKDNLRSKSNRVLKQTVFGQVSRLLGDDDCCDFDDGTGTGTGSEDDDGTGTVSTGSSPTDDSTDTPTSAPTMRIYDQERRSIRKNLFYVRSSVCRWCTICQH